MSMTTTGAGASRRDILKGGAGLAFFIGAGGVVAASAQSPSGDGEPIANAWASIHPDGAIRIWYGGTEMGQGSYSHAPLMLAEELDANWDDVTVDVFAEHNTDYGLPAFGGMLYTAGSATIEGYWDRMRQAGAQMRWVLRHAAANAWGVDIAEVTTEPSVVVHASSGRRLTYGEVAAFATVPDDLPVFEESELKPAEEFRYLGQSVPRLDVPWKSTGEPIYGIDQRVDGMLYASVLQAPVEGETPLEIDEGDARAQRGVVDIIPLPNAVAVVGEDYWGTVKAKRALSVTWSETSPYRAGNSAQDLEDFVAIAEDLEQEGFPYNAKGDVAAALDGADRQVQRTYRSDYAYHAAMEPHSALAIVNEAGDALELWCSTQTQSLTILGMARLLDTTPDKITLHPMFIGGGFGMRTPMTNQLWLNDAVRLSKETGRPVKVIWSREDDVQMGMFRTIAGQTMRAGLDGEGKLIAWNQRVTAPAPLTFMNPVRWEAAAGRDVIAMHGSENLRYDIPNQLAEHIIVDRRARICAWRGVGSSYIKFGVECFIDEIAEELGKDPLDYRLELCHHNERAKAVLNRVAEMAEWSRPRTDGSALGLALAGYKAALAAGIAEIRLDEETGRLTVPNYWIAADCGFAVSPRNVEAQVVGSAIFGISAALQESVEIVDGVVQASNFTDYPILRINETPNITCDLLITDNPVSGVGELGTPSTGPAIANAFFRLTGKRIRHMPFTPERVKAVLEA